jgi:4'-phosphopantetheinyl transferase
MTPPTHAAADAGVAPAGAPAGAAAGEAVRIRWAVDVGGWRPSAAELAFLTSLLPEAAAARCASFSRPDDVRRAVASALLQRACAGAALGVADVELLATRGRKPYVSAATAPRPSDAPNFNLNASHDGDMVVVGAESHCLIGVDVVAPPASHQQADGLAARLRRLRASFAEGEGELLQGLLEAGGGEAPGDAAAQAAFQRLWALKEAFIKARGDGLGFAPLSRAAFSFDGGDPWARTATVAVDGRPETGWRFFLHDLGKGHWAAVARGPPSAAVDADGGFLSTLRAPALAPEALAAQLAAHEPPFSRLAIEELLPPEAQPRYAALLRQAAVPGGGDSA